jgi:hypothetical protein
MVFSIESKYYTPVLYLSRGSFLRFLKKPRNFFRERKLVFQISPFLGKMGLTFGTVLFIIVLMFPTSPSPTGEREG